MPVTYAAGAGFGMSTAPSVEGTAVTVFRSSGAVCPRCGAPVRFDDAFCPQCGLAQRAAGVGANPTEPLADHFEASHGRGEGAGADLTDDAAPTGAGTDSAQTGGSGGDAGVDAAPSGAASASGSMPADVAFAFDFDPNPPEAPGGQDPFGSQTPTWAGGEPVPTPTPALEGVTAPAEAELVESLNPKIAGPAALFAVLLAIFSWLTIGPLSLLADVIVGVALFAVIRQNTWSMSVNIFKTAVADLIGLVRRVVSAPQRLRERRVQFTVVAVLMPLVVGVLWGLFGFAPHANRDDVCSAYAAFRQESLHNTSIIGSDRPLFNRLKELGTTAQDYAGANQDMVRSAGDRLVRVAEGNGGSIVTASQSQADAAMGDIPEMCYGD